MKIKQRFKRGEVLVPTRSKDSDKCAQHSLQSGEACHFYLDRFFLVCQKTVYFMKYSCLYSRLLIATCLASFVTPFATLRANEAVSALNGKIDAAYGTIHDTSSRAISATISAPVGDYFGVQIDTLYQKVAERDFYGLGGHFFTRKSSQGLLGLIVGGIRSNAVSNVTIGIEGEWYLDYFTVGGIVGYDSVMKSGSVISTYSPRLNTQRDFVLANLYAAVYPLPDLMLRFEWTNRLSRNFYDVTVEYQTPVDGLAIFGDVGVGDADFFQLLGGVRYYFGGKKSLKARHREDDPENFLNGVTGGSSLMTGAGQNSTPPGGGGGGGRGRER